MSWQAVLALVRASVDQLSALLTALPPEAKLGALLLPMLIALVSKRILTLLGAILLAITALILLVEPVNLSPTMGLAAYIGSILLALSGIAQRRRDAALFAKISSLRAELNQFAEAESRRFLVKLKTQDRNQPASAAPAERAHE